ncbi:hypothetical protein CXQ85_000621 [Candidozyma haemuli]|uniref:AAA+ ATPase domain-containing protein n=1 Tax=Candidozyma haemuli TaxID=45357 RepID=A0A2V1AUX6_9ASCO|nr:hypothetical protein CXQ85_000621 [[Candida] haemuloni]PVH21638.1 hypothetical protein CXQ85_000621 [[Candida] haemuloni]
MEEKCPLCFKQFPLAFLERHVNTCLDTLESSSPDPSANTAEAGDGDSTKLIQEDAKQHDPFAALGLKADSRKSNDKQNKKAKATLTSILIAERKLKRKQEDLEREIKRQTLDQEQDVQRAVPQVDQGQAESSSPAEHTVDGGIINSQSVTKSQLESTQTIPSSPDLEEEARYKARNQEILRLRREAELPLAQRLRPKTLDDFFGQEKLVGPNGILRNIMNADQIPSFILWGVPGVGKTSLARIIASSSNYKFVEISGADSNAKKLKEAFANAQSEKQLSGQKTILFLDEIHRFNKAVQDLLLPVLEKGTITAIGATTENPSFTLNNALLSRMHTFVMEPLSSEALVKILNRGLFLINKTRKLVHKLHLIAISRDAIDHIARTSTGDSRVALNILESINAYLSGLSYKAIKKNEPGKEIIEPQPKVGVIKIGMDELKPLLETHNFHQMYDRVGENHYDTISAFHKSVRGSDADAAIFYLVRMISGGEDPLFIARRMIVIASEDIGLRDSSCLPCSETSNSIAPTKCPTKLMKELGYGDTYKYNPSYKHGKVVQEFLPPELEGTSFVEKDHFKDGEDVDVSSDEMKKFEEERQAYEIYKYEKQKDAEKKEEEVRMRSKRHTTQLISSVENAAERLSSYDEFLDKSDQPEYFDCNENDTYSDDPEASHNFECSYDEFTNDRGLEQHNAFNHDESTGNDDSCQQERSLQYVE